MASTDPNVRTIRSALTCPEQEFATRAAVVVLGRDPTLHQVLDINEHRANGFSRGAILRLLIKIAADENLPVPEDWALALPQRIDVSGLISGTLSKTEFIVEAYRIILQRTPSAHEIAAQTRALRWPATRSDFVVALASCDEAELTGGEIVLVGLGRRGPSLKRFIGYFNSNSGKAKHQVSHVDALGDNPDEANGFHSVRELPADGIDRLSQSIATQILTASKLQSEKLERLNARADQLSSLSRQVSGVEATVGRIRTRMETEGAKSAEIASDTRVTQDLVRDLLGRMVEIERAVAALTCVPESVQRINSVTDRLASSVQANSHLFEEAAGVVRTLTGVPGEVQKIGDLIAKVAGFINRDTRVIPPVIPGGDAVVTQVDGFFLGVPVREWRLSTYYHNRGPLEPGIYKLFQNLIRPGMTVVDIGANVGLYTLLAARLLQGVGSVFSFEPTPDVFRMLKNNVQLNGFAESGIVHLQNSAVIDKSGVMPLYTDVADSTHNSLFPLPTQTEHINVPTVALDEALAEARPDVVKIDAEGSEPLVLRGMRRLMAKHPDIRIVLEFAPGHIRRSGIDPEGFLDELRRPGFILRTIDELSGELSPAANNRLLSAANTDLLVSRS